MPVACSAALEAGDGMGIKTHRRSSGPGDYGRTPVTTASVLG
jgi:hypothetical protein